MVERKPSTTAVRVAVLRAAHQLIDSEPKILDDAIVLRLLDQATLDGMRANPERFQTLRNRGLRTHILVRSRFAEDRLAAAVAGGIDQYVILGAGLDSFPYRQPDWAGRLHIFEVDHAASQQVKRQRLEAAGIPIPANLEYVPIDFETDTLASAFRQAGLDEKRPAFFSWLGVAIYLQPAAIEAVFRFVASLPRTSQIAFTFGSEENSEEADGRPSATEIRVAMLGEPWLTRYRPENLALKLHQWGFSEVYFLTPEEIGTHYLMDRADGLVPPRHVNTAWAKV